MKQSSGPVLLSCHRFTGKKTNKVGRIFYTKREDHSCLALIMGKQKERPLFGSVSITEAFFFYLFI